MPVSCDTLERTETKTKRQPTESLSSVHEKLFDVSKWLAMSQLLQHWQDVLCTVKCVDDVFVTTGDSKERPGVGDDDECQTVVEYVEEVLVLNLSQARV